MNIKLLFYSLIIILLSSCVGSDTAFLPQSIKEAKAENLLFDIYKPDKNIIKINDREYFINEAFTSTKFNSTRDKTINKNVFMFIFKLKNHKTEKAFESDFDRDFYDYINFYSKNGGIMSGNLSIDYENFGMRSKLDTIKIGFLDNNKKENTVTFIKQK